MLIRLVGGIIILLIFLLLLPCFSATVQGADWLTLSGSNNDIQTISISQDKITIIGTHAKSGARKHYRTVGYYLTLEQYDLSDYLSKGENASIYKVRLPVTVYDDFDYSPTIIQTTYTMERSDFMEAVAKLSLTPEDIRGGKAKVYLHNIFVTREYLDDTYTESAVTCGKDEIFGYKEMLEAPRKYQLGFTEWGKRTQEILPYYYNLEFTLTAQGLYDIEVVCEDGNGSRLTSGISLEKSGASGQKFSYDSVQSEITSDSGKRYQYTRQWYFSYIDRKSNLEKKIGINYGTKVNVDSMPDASAAVLHLIYDKTPEIPEAGEETGGSIEKDIQDPGASGIIEADSRGAERYEVTRCIPGGESVYAVVQTEQYLVGYEFVRHEGKKTYQVYASKDFELRWKGAGEDEILSETVTVTRMIPISRSYSYWEARRFELYELEKAVIRNEALENGQIILQRQDGQNLQAEASHAGSENYYIKAPVLSVTLPTEVIYSDTQDRPNPGGIFSEEVESLVGEIKVRNDKVIIGGTTVMSDQIGYGTTQAPNMEPLQSLNAVSKTELFAEENELKTGSANQKYLSEGSVTYRKVVSVSGGSANLSYPIYDLNEIRIHTPVVCQGIVEGASKGLVQAVNIEEGAEQLILDSDIRFSAFQVAASNRGTHLSEKGYGGRDYSEYVLRKNGEVKNEVKFPFDVFRMSAGGQEAEYIPTGTWTVIGEEKESFSPAIWTKEGSYDIWFRTTAANGDGKESMAETYANRDSSCYAATDSVRVQISGRIYGFSVFDISDYPTWEKVFRIPNTLKLKKDAGYPDGTKDTGQMIPDYAEYSYVYGPGSSDQYGRAAGIAEVYTLPVFYGSHPGSMKAGVLKTGYKLRFLLYTTGDGYRDDISIGIEPEFYFVKRGENVRIPVDLYYQENVDGKGRKLVKVGGAYDSVNIKRTAVKDAYLAIPEEELKNTAALRGETLKTMVNRIFGIFSFGRIQIPYGMRTYVGSSYYRNLSKTVKNTMASSGITEKKAEQLGGRGVQCWYGEYYLPGDVRAVKKGSNIKEYAERYGIDWKEDFWLKDGYLIVNLTIKRESSKESQSDLAYDNSTAGGANMWKIEQAKQTVQDAEGMTIKLEWGDEFLFRMDKSVSNDYPVSGVY